MGLWIYYYDGTKDVCGPGISTAEYEFRTYLSTYHLRIVGMKCVFNPNPSGQTTKFDECYGCVPYIETCDAPNKPFDAKTISDMTFTIKLPANPATTQDANFTQQGGVVGCGPRTYTLNPSTYTFLTRTGSAANGNMTGNLLSVSTSNPAHEGTYAISMTVTLTSFTAITVTKNFNVIITCQVSSMSFNQATPISATLIVGIDTQPMTVATYSVTKSPSCLPAPTFTVSDNPAFATNNPSGNGGTISVNGATAANTNRPTGSQLYTMTLTGVQGTASASIPINLTLKCGVTAIGVTQQPANASFVTNQGSVDTLSLDLSQTQDCQYPFSYSHSVTKDGSATTMPSWLSFNTSTRKFTYAPNTSAHVGVYVITTTSTIPNISGVTQVTQRVTSFTLTILHDCTITTLTNRALSGMTAYVLATTDSQSVEFQDSTGTGRGSVAYCGPRTYSLSPALAFLSISGTTLTLNPTLVS